MKQIPLWYSNPRFSSGSAVSLIAGAEARISPITSPSRLAHRGGAGRQIERVQRVVAPLGRAGRRQHRAEGVGEGAAEPGERRRVLVVDRLAQSGVVLQPAPMRGADRGGERRHGEIDRDIGGADQGQRLGGEYDDLGVGARGVGAGSAPSRPG